MLTLKQAFSTAAALQSNKTEIQLCEACPMHDLHKLCERIEGDSHSLGLVFGVIQKRIDTWDASEMERENEVFFSLPHLSPGLYPPRAKLAIQKYLSQLTDNEKAEIFERVQVMVRSSWKNTDTLFILASVSYFWWLCVPHAAIKAQVRPRGE